MTKISTQANILQNGRVVIRYSAGRAFGVVMFDEHGRIYDQTRETLSTKGRGFCEIDELPAGVYAAARAARKAAVA